MKYQLIYSFLPLKDLYHFYLVQPNNLELSLKNWGEINVSNLSEN